MKVQSENIKIERSGEFKENQFRIQAGAKAFKILSDGLYSDKVKAIVRELATNAYDAQVEAKSKKEFVVHLPNAFEPYFSIRDYGTGMSCDKIENLYTTYFGSDKTRSNDLVGCLGLGSKSPFSYTDNFTVVSFLDGKKYVYSAIIAEEGFPSIVRMSEEDTDEENGVEVTVAVKRNDFQEFARKAKEVFQYFSPRPKIIGSPITFDDKGKPAFEGECWKVYQSGRSYYNRRDANAVAIMGNIAYKIEDKSGDHEALRLITQADIEIYFDIGELEMAASREALSYTPFCIANLKKKATKVLKDLAKIAESKVADAPNLWQARIQARKVASSLSLFQDVWKLSRWKGKSLDATADGWDDKISIRSYKSSHSYNAGAHVASETQDIWRIHADENIIFVENDLVRGSFTACKKHAIDTGKTVLLVDFRAVKKKEKKAFLDILGIDESFFTSAASLIPERVKGPRKKRSKQKSVYKWDVTQTAWSKPRTFWKEESIDASAGGIYVPVYRWCIGEDKTTWGNVEPRDFRNLLILLKSLGVEVKDIIGIKQSQVEAFKKKSTAWVSFYEHVTSKINEVIETKKLTEVHHSSQVFNHSSHYAVFQRLTKALRAQKQENIITSWFDVIEQGRVDSNNKALTQVQDITNILKNQNSEVTAFTSNDAVNLVTNKEREILDKYPMLAIGEKISSWEMKNVHKLFFDYVKLIDSIIPPKKKKKIMSGVPAAAKPAKPSRGGFLD